MVSTRRFAPPWTVEETIRLLCCLRDHDGWRTSSKSDDRGTGLKATRPVATSRRPALDFAPPCLAPAGANPLRPLLDRAVDLDQSTREARGREGLEKKSKLAPQKS